MRVATNKYQLTCHFVEDAPDGGCIVETPDGKMNTNDMNEYEPFYCKDGTEIFYPQFAEW